jgi:hypothetical protein
MKSKFLVCATAVLAVAMFANLSVMPALAKPYQVTVVLKDEATGKPVTQMRVVLIIHKVSGDDDTPADFTDVHGKVVFDLTPGIEYTSFDVTLWPSGEVLDTNLPFKGKMSARVTIHC